MQLITKDLEQKLPPLYSQEEKGDDATAHLKLFTPWAGWTWYITEYDPERDLAFGLVDGMEAELGYVSLKELREVKGPAGLTIERDLYFEPTTIGEIKKQIQRSM